MKITSLGDSFENLSLALQPEKLDFQQASLQPRSRRKNQESLANAKVSARQPWYGCNSLKRPSLRKAKQYQRNLYIVEKYFQCGTMPSLKMLVCLHSFSCYCVANTRSGAKFRENLNLQQLKIIRGR